MTDRELMQQAREALKLLVNRPTEEALDYADNAITAIEKRLAQPEQEPDIYPDEAYEMGLERIAYYTTPPPQPDHFVDATKMVPFQELAAELFAVAQISPADDGFSDTMNRIEAWLRNHFSTPPQRKPLPPQSPCEMTQAEGKMFKLGWLECEAAHGIKGEA